MTTKIEWAEESWNPVTGCTQCSPGCDHCYAKRMAHRLKGRYGYPKDDPFRVTFHWNRLDMPLRWKKSRRVFVCSMSDLFHDDVSFDFINRALFFAYQSYKQKHIFIFLTKRPEKMSAALDNWRRCNALELLPKNWHIGVTVCNQKEADAKIPILLQIPVAVRFISFEPLLSRINAAQYAAKLDWAIIGCESGPKRRHTDIEWIEDLKDTFVIYNKPVFIKQAEINGKVVKVPKIDGKEWNQYPERGEGWQHK